MLKGIPRILSPELLKVLCEMGHGDRILIADGNFPCESMGKNSIVIRCDGHGIPELLEAVLTLMPLDHVTDKPVKLMRVSPGEDVDTPIWNTYFDLLDKYDRRGRSTAELTERYEFYEHSRGCYAIIATGESALYANIMLQKGVVV
ncbi:MAG: fucose isomerase [Clostridia bacterium]|nr:fucose isomerase [Clostridia bacterium]